MTQSPDLLTIRSEARSFAAQHVKALACELIEWQDKSVQPQLTPRAKAYLDELAADIAANGGFEGVSVIDAVTAAHQRRQAFALEMASGGTKRAQMARKALVTSVWIDANVTAAQKRLAVLAKDSTRAFFLACDSIESNS